MGTEISLQRDTINNERSTTSTAQSPSAPNNPLTNDLNNIDKQVSDNLNKTFGAGVKQIVQDRLEIPIPEGQYSVQAITDRFPAFGLLAKQVIAAGVDSIIVSKTNTGCNFDLKLPNGGKYNDGEDHYTFERHVRMRLEPSDSGAYQLKISGVAVDKKGLTPEVNLDKVSLAPDGTMTAQVSKFGNSFTQSINQNGSEIVALLDRLKVPAINSK